MRVVNLPRCILLLTFLFLVQQVDFCCAGKKAIFGGAKNGGAQNGGAQKGGKAGVKLGLDGKKYGSYARKPGRKPIYIVILQLCDHPSAKYPPGIFDIHPDVFYFEEVMQPLFAMLNDESFFVTHPLWCTKFRLDELKPSKLLRRADDILEHIDCKFGNTAPDIMDVDSSSLAREDESFKKFHQAVKGKLLDCKRSLTTLCNSLNPKKLKYGHCADKIAHYDGTLKYITEQKNGGKLAQTKFLSKNLELLVNSEMIVDEDAEEANDILSQDNNDDKLDRLKTFFSTTDLYNKMKKKASPHLRKVVRHTANLTQALGVYIRKLRKFYHIDNPELEKERGLVLDNRISYSYSCLNLVHDAYRHNRDLLRQQCLKSVARAISFYRMHLIESEKFLAVKRNASIIVLECDPRHGIYGNKKFAKQPIATANKTCIAQKENLDILKKLEKNYPGAYYRLKIEDLHKNLVKEIRSVYDFVSLKEDEASIKKVAFGLKKYPITGKDNLAAFENNWLQDDMEIVKSVDDLCGDVLNEMNFPTSKDKAKQ